MSAEIKTWQERIVGDMRTFAVDVAKNAEIAELRAALAQKETAAPVDLPVLPKCYGSIDVYHDDGQVTSVDGWTADQMRGYAIDALAHPVAVDAPINKLVDDLHGLRRWNVAADCCQNEGILNTEECLYGKYVLFDDVAAAIDAQDKKGGT